MADVQPCDSSLCAHERKLIKKELLTWTKKVPVLIGFEVLAETIIGSEAVAQLLHPFIDETCVSISDWKPDQPCNMCTVLRNMTNNQEKHISNLRQQTDKSDDINSVMLHYGLQTDHVAPSYDGYSDEELDAPLDLSQCSTNGRSSDPDQYGRPSVQLKVPRILQKVCKNSTTVTSAKKNYTEQELTAATTDIFSGKIGTRQASNIYGIPRSTLRNKIFRMRMDSKVEDDQRVSSSMSNMETPVFPYEFLFGADQMKPDFSHFDWNIALDRLKTEGGLHRDLEFQPPHFMNHSYFMEGENDSQKYDCSTGGGGLMSQRLPFLDQLIREATKNQVKTELEEPQEFCLPSKSGWKKNSFMGLDDFRREDGLGSELRVPFYKPAKLVDKPLGFGFPQVPDWNGAEDVGPRTDKINSMLKDVITKTISEKFSTPSPTKDALTSGPNSETHSSDGSLSSEPLPKRTRIRLAKSTDISASNSSSPDIEASQHGDSRSTSGSSDGEKSQTVTRVKNISKKTRPKRGQYRRYNRQLLLEAVRAVQQGDMSVHRAGSYYGVPHSTLEYKVKERHLLRQKKINENSKNNDSTNAEDGRSTTSSVATTISSSDTKASSLPTGHSIAQMLYGNGKAGDDNSGSISQIRPFNFPYPSEDIFPSSTPALPLSFGCFQGSSLPVGFGWPPLVDAMFPLSSISSPLFGVRMPSFGFNMSASDLLKRLQQKAQASAGMMQGAPKDDTEISSPNNRLATLSPDLNSGRSSACSVDSPQVVVK